MTTCLDLVTRAFRALGVVGAGEAPSGNHAADGLQHRQDLINGLPLLRDGAWRETVLSSDADHVAADGDRISTGGFAAAITLPPTYVDGCGRTLPMRDLSRVQVTDAVQPFAGQSSVVGQAVMILATIAAAAAAVTAVMIWLQRRGARR